MQKINFGLKLWSTNLELLKESIQLIKNDVFQYIELSVIPDVDPTQFQGSNVPYILHMPPDKLGLNLGDSSLSLHNQGLIDKCLEWMDILRAQFFILHPGWGNLDVVLDFLKKYTDRRIIIENMPKIGINGEQMIGYSPEQIKKLTANQFGFCFDINHAVKTAISLKKDYKTFIPNFLNLRPAVFHISDGNLRNELDEHLNVGAGDYDFHFIMNVINQNTSKFVTLETPKNLNSLERDIENLNRLRQYI